MLHDTTRSIVLGTTLGVLMMGAAASAQSYRLVSVPDGATEGIGGVRPTITADGTRVVFFSTGKLYQDGRPNPPGAPDEPTLFVKNLQTGTLTALPFLQPMGMSPYAMDAQATLVITNGPFGKVLYRYAEATGVVRILADRAADPRMSADGSVIAWRTPWELDKPVIVSLLIPGQPYPASLSTLPLWCPQTECVNRAFDLSADGRFLSYFADVDGVPTLVTYDTFAPCCPELSLRLSGRPLHGLVVSGDGRYVVFAEYEGPPTQAAAPVTDTYLKLYDRQTGRVTDIGFDEQGQRSNLRQGDPAITPNGRFVTFTVFGFFGETNKVYVRDLWTGQTVRVNTGLPEAPSYDGASSISATGRFVAFKVGDLTGDVYVVDLDTDGDGMWDSWESTYGLDPTTAADGVLDADGDGVSNADEFLAASHPTASPAATRIFAEGADGTFFRTRLSVFNPGAVPAALDVRFATADGHVAHQQLTLPALGRADVDPGQVATLQSDAFAIAVESNQPIVADRTMTWDRSTAYGAHASTGVAAASTTWYFAEGATTSGFQLFYLLYNPSATVADVTIEYLLATGNAVSRTYHVPAGARFNVWANAEAAPVNAAEFAATVTSTVPIVAERAMYLSRNGQMFAAGSGSVGVTAPALEWQFAEGATGPFFDTFLLLANPGDSPANIAARYSLPGGLVVQRAYVVPARARLTVWLDQEDASLADSAVSTSIVSDVPVVAERAMWWPGDASTWVEAHTEAGATESALRWATADGALDDQNDTFLLILNPSEAQAASVTVTAHVTGQPPVQRVIAAPPSSRTTVWFRNVFPELLGQRFSTVVSSDAPVVVERAMYSNGFESGTASLATPLEP